MDKWRHLFIDGEYAARERILSGLTLDQVSHKSSEQSHSIYEELWHAAKWQSILVRRDEEQYQTWLNDELYPARPPTVEDWDALVKEFLSGLDGALQWTTSPEKMSMEVAPGETMEDVLHSLAVHTAYHLGKIVAIRQAIGAWPPQEVGGQ